MKTQSSKIMNWILALSLIAPAAASAGSADSSEELLNAQVQVTRDAIQQVVTKMRNASQGSSEFSNADFIAEAKAFDVEVDKAMTRFETTLKNDILKQAGFYLNRLNAILNSTAYSPSQKGALLRDQAATTQTVFNDLAKKYSAALYELYIIDMPKLEWTSSFTKNDEYPCLRRSYSWGGQRPGSYSKNGVYYVVDRPFAAQLNGANFKLDQGFVYYATAYYSNDSIIPNICPQNHPANDEMNLYGGYYSVYFEALREPVFTEVVRNRCYTSSCLALYSNHRLAYFNLIRDSLDKDLTFNAGGYELKIRRAGMPYSINQYLMLQSGESLSLPFDITEVEYQRTKKIEGIKKQILLNNRTGGFFSSWSCPAAVKPLKEEICALATGCLSSQEQNSLVDWIRSSQFSDQSKRISCVTGS